MKYKKELTIAIAVILVTVGRQVRLNEIRENIFDKGSVQQKMNKDNNLKDKTNIGQIDYDEWVEYREKEKAEGGIIYRIEDLMPEFNKPTEWEDFFVIKKIPDGFYLKDTIVEEKNGWTITYCFVNNTEENIIYFIQSSNDYLKEKSFLNGRKMEENKYYIGKYKEYNIICWLENDITICLKTNMSVESLDSLTKEVDSYYNVDLNYLF